MAIHSIDKVTIDGKNRAFGGFIYAVDYDLGVLDNPTKITVTLVNGNGIYAEPELSVSKPYNIKIGNIIHGNFYAIQRTSKKSSSGRVLEVVFYDGSIILDRIWVGLNKRMGDPNKSVPGLILVGKEMHPCDANEDGVFDVNDVALLEWQKDDPCELRCPGDAEGTEPAIKECIDKEQKDILEVKYSIVDLFDALEGKTQKPQYDRTVSYPIENDLSSGFSSVSVTLPPLQINLNSAPENKINIKKRPAVLNTFLKNNYTGTLREVLKNWCGDFGWSFTWEDGALVFIDTKERPNIAFPDFSDQLNTISDTKTLEGTVSRGFNSAYLQPGINATKDCKQTAPILLHCLTLVDLFGEYYKPRATAIEFKQGNFGAKAALDPNNAAPLPPANMGWIAYKDSVKAYVKGVPIESFELACVLSKYDSNLRNLWTQWNYYQILKDADAVKYQNMWLDRLGQIRVLAVYGRTQSTDKFISLLPPERSAEDKKNGTNLPPPNSIFSEEESNLIRKNQGFILVVKRLNKQEGAAAVLEKQHRVESSLASQFMGLNWYRAYRSPSYGGTPEISPDGKYYGELSTDINDLTFCQFGHSDNSKVANIVGTYLQKQLNDYRSSIPFSSGAGKGSKIVRSMLYFQRSVGETWYPVENAKTDTLQTVIDKYVPYAPLWKDMSKYSEQSKKILVTVGGVDMSAKLGYKTYDDIDILVLFPPPENPKAPNASPLNVTFKQAEHLNKTYPQYSEGKDSLGMTTMGMLSNKCFVYTIAGSDIYTPIGGSVHFNEDKNPRLAFSQRLPSKKDFSQPAYKVLVTSTISNRGVVPKTEMVYTEYANMNEALRVEYKTQALDRNSMRFLNQLTSECRLDPKQILALHELLSKNLNYSVTKPFRSVQYEIFGVNTTEPLSPSTGLESLRVRIDGQGGVTTSISIGDKLFTPVKEDVVLRALELGISPKLAALTPNPI